MKRVLFAVTLLCALSAYGREAKLTRYPSYHQGRVAFSFMGDVWTCDDNGSNVQRLTANAARDIYPRFSPDGKWIAFSSDRNGNLDVYIIRQGRRSETAHLPFGRRTPVLGWSPDSQRRAVRQPARARISWASCTPSRSTAGWSAAQGRTWASRVPIRRTVKS
jgi:tricorn protease